ncbi:MAG: STAS domain-containing protein [Bacillota bacterium]
MKISVETKEHTLIIKLAGTFDLHTAVYFKQEINNYLNRKIKGLILDLEDIEFIDSSGIGAVLSIYKKMEKKRGKIAIINVNPNLKRIFELSGILKIINLYPSQQLALQNI